MIYGIMKSIRAHANAWMLTLGIVVAILPLVWFITATITFKAIHIRHWDDPVISYSRPEAFSLWMFDVLHTKPFAYFLFGSWIVGAAVMCLALIRMVRRRVFRRKLNELRSELQQSRAPLRECVVDRNAAHPEFQVAVHFDLRGMSVPLPRVSGV